MLHFSVWFPSNPSFCVHNDKTCTVCDGELYEKCCRTWTCVWSDHQSVFNFFCSPFYVHLKIECVVLECFSDSNKNARKTDNKDGKQTAIMSHVLSINSRQHPKCRLQTQSKVRKERKKRSRQRATSCILYTHLAALGQLPLLGDYRYLLLLARTHTRSKIEVTKIA